MLVVREINRIQDLKRIWSDIPGGYGHPYTTFSFYYEFFRKGIIYFILLKEKRRTFVVFDGSKPVLIAPLKFNVVKREYSTYGNYSGFRDYDFIYDQSIDFEAFSQYADCLFSSFNKGIKIGFHSLLQSSYLKKYLDNRTNASSQINCVSITTNGKYDDYINLLSKHSKQNLRTAYNRLKRGGVEYDFVLYSNSKNVNAKIKTEIIDLYSLRHENRYGIKKNPIKSFYMRHFDAATKLQTESECSFLATIEFNHQVAAFMSGYIDGDKIIIPRLSINDNWAWYSPGCILINEFFKNTNYKILDLGMGEEAYKYQMGGKLYQKYNYTMERIK